MAVNGNNFLIKLFEKNCQVGRKPARKVLKITQLQNLQVAFLAASQANYSRMGKAE